MVIVLGIIWPVLEGITLRQVVTTGGAIAISVTMVSNADKFSESNYLIKRDGTRNDILIVPLQLSSKKEDSTERELPRNKD